MENDKNEKRDNQTPHESTWWTRLGWLIAIWLVSVLALGVVALIIKKFMTAAGMSS